MSSQADISREFSKGENTVLDMNCTMPEYLYRRFEPPFPYPREYDETRGEVRLTIEGRAIAMRPRFREERITYGASLELYAQNITGGEIIIDEGLVQLGMLNPQEAEEELKKALGERGGNILQRLRRVGFKRLQTEFRIAQTMRGGKVTDIPGAIIVLNGAFIDPQKVSITHKRAYYDAFVKLALVYARKKRLT